MKQILLIAGLLTAGMACHAQLDHSTLDKAYSNGERHFSAAGNQQNAIVSIQDTLHYFFNKHYYKNPTLNNANTQFFTIKSPYEVSALNLTHAGSIFLNTATVMVHGLEALVMRHPTSASSAVGVKILLYNVNSNNLPIMPAVDSVLTTVSTSTAGVWVGGNFASPKTMTANFAVAFKIGSSNPLDTIRLFLNNAAAPSSTVTGVPKYGESLGLLRYSAQAGFGWIINTGQFGSGTDYEFVVAPRVSFSYQSGIGVNSPTVCNNSLGTFSNTSSPQSLIENRQFNFNKFAAYWAPTNTLMPITDSIYGWSFTGATPPTTTAKNPSVLFTTPGVQNASLTARYWYSVNAGLSTLPTFDATQTQITVDPTSSPTISVQGFTNICAGQSTTLTVSGNPTFTWTSPASNSNAIVVSPVSLTVYTVQANNGACTAVKFVTVQVSPQPNLQVTGPNSACAGKSYTLVASGASSYSWNTSQTNATVTPISFSAGLASYTVYGFAGTCPTVSLVKNVTIHALPTVSLTAATQIVCTKSTGGGTLALSGTPPGGTYSGINVVGSSFVPQDNTGTFSLQYSYTDPSTSCSANSVMSVSVSLCTGLDNAVPAVIGVYPNPALDGITNLSNMGKATSLEVFNILGEKVRSEPVSGDHHRLDLAALPQGQYFIRICAGNEVTATVKIVNQH